MKAFALALLVVASALVAVPTAAAEPACYDIYNEYEVGPVTIIQRSSCSYEVCYEGRCGLLQ